MAKAATHPLRECSALPSPNTKSPSRIGSIRTRPCIVGMAIAGQRDCIALRRSDQSSAAVNAA